ncbi:MAG: Gfo/Idh/MocA family oxidoreductase [Firmicutes bacterium]|nr:Gfo/Idh/MocA family oxidoreductase [Bacillota bacterium]
MKKTVNVGLVGYKFMGRAHSNAYRQAGKFFDMSADVVMKALCGREENWVKESAEKLGWEGYETSWEELVRRPDIDAVDITAPSNTHREIAIAAAKNGKHVFVEKPLALNSSDARQMLAAAEENGIRHQIGFNYRFAPAVLLAKKIIDEGKIGKVFHFRGNYLQDYIIDPSFPLVWRLDKKVAGSGSLGDLGAHVIDLARFLVGDIDRVTGITRTFIKERPVVERMTGLSGKAAGDAPMGEVTVDDGAAFLAEFKNGAMGVFEATRFAAGHKNALTFEINGSNGSLKFELERMNELQYFSRDDAPDEQGFRTIGATEDTHPYIGHWWPAGHIIGYEHTFIHEIYEFIEAVANDRKTSPDFGDGLKCCQILDAVEKSADTGMWVAVDEM